MIMSINPTLQIYRTKAKIQIAIATESAVFQSFSIKIFLLMENWGTHRALRGKIISINDSKLG